MKTCGAALIALLEQYQVDTIFGIPGVHTLGLYGPLVDSTIRHITPRHEQGAGFMADGYARVTGRPGVCMLISGPGLTNAATAIAQAYSDSIPMLVLSSVHERRNLGLGRGFLHEMPSQHALMSSITAFSHTLLHPDALPEVLARAFNIFSCARPRPVHIEIPIDILLAPFNGSVEKHPSRMRPGPNYKLINEAASLLSSAQRPTVLLGGGAVDTSDIALKMIELLDSPVVLTNASKGVVPASHPLCVGSTLRRKETQELLANSDVVLAVGTELGETDSWTNGNLIGLGTKLIRIDIDHEQLERMAKPDIGIVSDAGLALSELHKCMMTMSLNGKPQTGSYRAASTIKSMNLDWRPDSVSHAPVLNAFASSIPTNAIVVADSTQIMYTGSQVFPSMVPRSWLTSMTGFGTLGYALPASIGAKLAAIDRPTICIIGDGGIMFTLGELATAVQENLSIPIVIWNNAGYAEIGLYMDKADIRRCGVDLHTPDFALIAKGFGCNGVAVKTIEELSSAITAAFNAKGPTLIDVDAQSILDQS